MTLRKKYWAVFLLVCLAGVGATVQLSNMRASTLRSDPTTILASCSPSDKRYAALLFSSTGLTGWIQNYHDTTADIINEFSTPAQNIACKSAEILPVTASDNLYELAKKLPPWSNDKKLQDLRRSDVGFVLLEFLRIYECALLDRGNFTTAYVQEGYAQGGNPQELRMAAQNSLIKNEQIRINEELAIARPTLEKALQIVAGNTRLSVLDAELQCFQRVSLDLRNALSLAADASSCLPRIWNAKDVLRNIQN